MKKANKLLLTIFSFGMLAISSIGCTNQEKVVNNEKDNSINNQIKELITDKVISTSSVVGSANPSGYYFSSDGRFSYYKGDYCVKEENEIIKYSGTYKIEDSKIILTYSNEVKAVNGSIVEDAIEGTCLTDYKEETSNNEVNKEFKIKDVNTNNNEEYMVLDDENNTRYYVLHVEKDPYALALK